ncbi:MAG: DUF1963 domain-containing protein [Planctomycetes bacterium]|nr:DUF1963 domain-containing protein [Planctomycetota bacterium]
MKPDEFLQAYTAILAAQGRETDPRKLFQTYPAKKAAKTRLSAHDQSLLCDAGLPKLFSLLGVYDAIKVADAHRIWFYPLADLVKSPPQPEKYASFLVLGYVEPLKAHEQNYLCLDAESGRVAVVYTQEQRELFVNSSLEKFLRTLCLTRQLQGQVKVEVEVTHGGVRPKNLFKFKEQYLKKLTTLDAPAAAQGAFWSNTADQHVASCLPEPVERPLRLPLRRPRQALMTRAAELHPVAPALTIDDLALLLDELESARLSSADQMIAQSAQLRLRFFDAGEDDYSQPGATRFGGDPDLPTGWDWPAADAPEPERTFANFLAQFNLAQLPKLPDNPLPRRGVLFVFLTRWTDGEPPVIRFLHYGGPASKLRRRSSPAEAQLASEFIHDLPPRRTTCGIRLDVPLADKRFREEVARLCADESQIDEWDLIDTLTDLGRPREERACLGQLLGYANTPSYQDDLYEEVVLNQKGKSGCQHYSSLERFDARMKSGRKDLSPAARARTERLRKDVQWYLKNRAAIRREAKSWRLLFELHSNEAMKLELGDAGAIYSFIRQTDLVNGDFAETAGVFEQC